MWLILMMNKRIFASLFVLGLIISLSLISAQNSELSEEDFNKYLEELKDGGELNQEVINNLENLPIEKRNQILKAINSESTDFWKQWKKDLTGEQKKDFIRGVNPKLRQEFISDYGQQYGVELLGLGDEVILFADRNVIGNKKGYFSMDKVEEYNQNNPDNKITSIEFKKDEGYSSLIFKKADGNTLDLTVGDSERGFYFDPDLGNIGRIGDNGLVNKEDPFTGKWNGEGSLKIDATNSEVKMSFDFNRNSEGEANDPANFPQFSNSKDSYSTFQHPSGKEEDGKTKYDLKPGELTFDKDGKLIKANNMYKNEGKKSWGGFFGEDTAITYNDEDFENTEGSKVMIGLENGKIGKIKTEVKRVQGGFAGALIEKQKLAMGELGKKLDSTKGDIGKALTTLGKAQSKVYEAQLAKSEMPDAKGDKLNELNLNLKLAEAELDITEKTIKYGIGRSLNLVKEDPLFDKALTDPNQLNIIEKGRLAFMPSPDLGPMNPIATKGGLSITKSILTFASTATGAAGDFASWLSEGAETIENPLLNSLNPAEGTRINLQLSKEVAGNMKNIEMYAGNLRVADSRGQLHPIVTRATTHGYVLPSEFDGKFKDMDFILTNQNYEGGQNIRISSDRNGNLDAVGVGGLETLKSKNGQYVVNAGGGITIGLLGYKGKSRNVLIADYEVSEDSLQRANAFREKANGKYRDLYFEYQKDGINSEENEKLWELWNNNFIDESMILGSKDVALSVRSSELRKSLNGLSGSGGDSISDEKGILNRMVVKTFISDKNLQRQLSQRGIGLTGAEDFVKAELTSISNYLKSNPSNTLKFTKDSSNGIYQIKTDYSTYNIDPIAGPFIANILPVVTGSGTLNNQNKFIIDTQNSRFGNALNVNVYGGEYGLLKALFNRKSIEANVQYSVEVETRRQMLNPASGNPSGSQVQVYTPQYQNNNKNTRKTKSKRRWNAGIGGGARGYRRR